MNSSSNTFVLLVSNKQSGKLTTPLLVLLVICLFGRVAEAEYGDGNDTIATAETSTYVFLSEQSKVVKVGGFAAVHETYPIEGKFRLTVDFDAGTASFSQVDANLIDESGLLYERSLGVIFNMSELLGTVVDDTTIEFVGKTADGMDSTILLTLTFRDDLAHLAGRTVPPPNSADFFIFELDAVALKKYGGGTGEPNDLYLIFTAEQMNEIGAEPNDWDKHFKLIADIDLGGFTGTAFNIIRPSYGNRFGGVFDGNGKTISNFKYTCIGTDRIGLFGCVAESAQIKDLGLIDPNVEAGTGNYVGSLVGENSGTITGCYAQGGTVSGNDRVGGLVGANGTISNCYFTGNVLGNLHVGGLTGYTWDVISNCYVKANVSGGYTVGGLIGWNNGIVKNCCSAGVVSGRKNVGGLIGTNDVTITDCYSTASVMGDMQIGGIVGGNCWDATIINCYSTGNISGNKDVGGLLGLNSARQVGILDSVIDSFWDVETSGQETSDGGVGKTTAEMQAENTFTDAGWDFMGESVNGIEDIWSICEGTNYPRLAWQIPAGDFVCPDGITIDDFLFFIEHWRDDNCDLSNDYCQGTDLDFSGTVDEADLEIFLENWLAEVRSD